MTSDCENRNEATGWRPTRTRSKRRRDRAQGVDRYGRPLPRVAGTNPRAASLTTVSERARKWRVPHAQLEDFARQERLACFVCKGPRGPWAAGGWREGTDRDPNPSWVICVRCVRRRKELRQAA